MTEPTMNQYAPPVAHVEDMTRSGEAVGELKYFSAEGRIGRIRYLAYITGAVFLHNIATSVLNVALGGSAVAGVASLVALLFLIVFAALCAIKRCHDMGISGWWTIVGFIPFVALVGVFWPGTRGDNRFGPPPPANTWGVRILGLIFPVAAFVGILAAVAIPQYKNYTDRARAAQSQGPK